MPSILDRLIDPESGGTVARRGYNLEQMLEVVRRDVEELLNTRQTGDLPAQFPKVRQSIFAFGLPDLTSRTALTPDQRAELAKTLEETLARYEPRLKDIRATLIEVEESKEFTVRFRIEARVAMDPAPEVVFDTVLQLRTGEHSVKPGEP